MKIKRLTLLTLIRWLSNLPLERERSKERSKFISEAKNLLSNIDAKRNEILLQYVDKDKNGDPILEDKEDGAKEYKLSDSKRAKAYDEFNEFLNEQVELPEKDNKQKIKVVKEILKTTDYEFAGNDADQYLEWVNSFGIENE